MSAVTKYMKEFGVQPDSIVDLRGAESDNPEIVTTHRHVVVILDDDSELWLDIATDHVDHNHADIRWMNPAGEMKGTGAFTIVNGVRQSLRGSMGDNAALKDTNGKEVTGHDWNGGYVITLLVDKNGDEAAAVKPSDGNG